MGNTLEQKEVKTVQPTSLHKSDFNFHYVIGKGGFGRVWKVEMRKTHQILAMKEMYKFRVVSKRSVYSVMNERKLLSILKHPFIVNMQYAFQDKENLFLAMDLMTGGDLRFHIGKVRRFTEEETRFFVACIVTGLEYLHVNGVIHRDIKPENLVFDNKGYLRITDFGIAKIFTPENFRDTSGTPGYMAPEVMCRQNHGIAVDYFALGVLTYEFMVGRRPYSGRNRKEIKDGIMSRQVQLKKSEVPPGWSMEAADFINKLLQRKPENRLGNNGPHEVKNHQWLRDFPWKKLLEKSLEAPYICLSEDNFDSRVNNDWKDDIDPSIRQKSIEGIFEGYFFDARAPPRRMSDEKIQIQKGEESTVQIRYQENIQKSFV
ncbi:unnamed protein product [Blepharisma stoltei]|uniref:non-specific serine/threonine protein kinase n=1 Tax=Blepharisma stoltei TaxID=1481888 RepID=A0AAU9IES5_9CILI|nr:unnamed protein product [Blepharisma stoltei]